MAQGRRFGGEMVEVTSDPGSTTDTDDIRNSSSLMGDIVIIFDAFAFRQCSSMIFNVDHS